MAVAKNAFVGCDLNFRVRMLLKGAVIDLETYVKSSRLAWLNRTFSEGSSPWKAYIKYLLGDFGGVFLFSCNYDVKDCKVTSTFYRDLLQWWAELRSTFSTMPSISYNIVWNN